MDELKQSDESPLKELSPEEFAQILEAHQKWLSSGMPPGSWGRADLSGCNLINHNLHHAKLSHAVLRSANLHGMDLRGAEFIDTDLTKADMRKADLNNANLIRANLTDANLRDAVSYEVNLEEAQLVRADLEHAHLIKAKLSGANLNGANLRMAKASEAELRGASLIGAIIRDADLQDAELSGVKGLLAGQLAGANVSGAKLPKDIGKFEGLIQVKELSQSAIKLFLGMLSACVYSWLTIATTTDVRLITNSASSPLPIIQTEIPIVGFYWVVPILLLSIYFYFHLYLQRLWDCLAILPAVFPDGTPLDRKAYPWLLNGLVRAHFPRLRNDRPPFSRLQVGISILLAWWLVPLTLVFFWLRFLPQHDWPGTALHISLIILAIGSAVLFQRITRYTLRGTEEKPFHWKTAYRDMNIYGPASVAIAVGCIFSILSFGAIEGVRAPIPHFIYKVRTPVTSDFNSDWPRPRKRRESHGLKASYAQLWVPRAFKIVGYNVFADISDADVSTKLANRTGLEENRDEDIALVRGARLRHRDLRFIEAAGAFFQRADLEHSDLRYADLVAADFRQTNLADVNMLGADLALANLQEASLQRTNLEEANLAGTDFRGAKFSKVKLRNADLRDADLSQARFLTQEEIDLACVDESTKPPSDLRKPPPCPDITVIKSDPIHH